MAKEISDGRPWQLKFLCEYSYRQLRVAKSPVCQSNLSPLSSTHLSSLGAIRTIVEIVGREILWELPKAEETDETETPKAAIVVN
ncbi:MAG: hypothetical protein WAM58_25210 [Candidatus Acidiferrum sp.]